MLANDPTSGGVAFIIHINGEEVSVNGSLTPSDGTVVTLLSSGNLEIDSAATQIGLTAEETIKFTCTADDGTGISDTAFVTVTAIPCFVLGTMIRTAPDTLNAGEPIGLRYTTCLKGRSDGLE